MSAHTLRCKVGDICITRNFGTGLCDNGNDGRICEIVGPAQRSGRDWSVRIPGRPSTWKDGTWAAMDSWLIPLRGDLRDDETPTGIDKPQEVTE